MKNRSLESLAPLFKAQDPADEPLSLILLSPSDIGVRRNFGRNGARFAPKTLINQLKKLNNHSIQGSIKTKLVSSQIEEEKNFLNAQKLEAKNIKSEIQNSEYKKLIHLGGGHDHVYPLLCGIQASQKYKNIVIFNVDAHCDTRVDDRTHSGTPFRDFANEAHLDFHLIQFGIHDYSNSKSTISKLKKGTTEHIHLDQIRKRSKNFSESVSWLENVPFEISDETLILISLDCDGLDGSSMQAVSAVNPNGLPAHYLDEIIKEFKSFKNLAFGIYEFNPVYETTGLLSTKVITSLIYQYLK